MNNCKDKSPTNKEKKLYIKICRHCGEKVEYYHGEKFSVCPFCGKDDFVKPETETTLFILQKKYLETRDSDTLGDMYKILCEYARSKVKVTLNGIAIYTEEQIREKAIDAVNLMIDYYLTKPNFKVETSFMGYLQTQIKSILYGPSVRKLDEIVSLNAIMDDDSKKELLDYVIEPIHEGSLNQEYQLNEIFGRDLTQGIMNIINDIHNEIFLNNSYKTTILTLIGIKHYVSQKTEDFKIDFYDKFEKYKIKELVDKSMMLIYKFIKEED